jgi:hypothetical protein
MIFTILFALWTLVLAVAALAPRQAAVVACLVMLVLSGALFVHHMTDPLMLSF